MNKIIIALAALALFNCASMTTVTTAEVLPSKAVQGFVNVGAGMHTIFKDSSNQIDTTSDGLLFEVGARLGINESMDLGLKSTFNGNAVDLKYQFYNQGMFMMAADLALGYDYRSKSYDTTSLFSIIPTAIVTFKPFDWASATVAPKMRVGIVTGEYSDAFLFQGGFTGALRFKAGDKGFFAFEIGNFWGTADQTHVAFVMEGPVFHWFGSTPKEKTIRDLSPESEPAETPSQPTQSIDADQSNTDQSDKAPASSGDLSGSNESSSF